MRLASALVLISILMQACISSPFENPSSKVTGNAFPAKLRSFTNDSRDIPNAKSPQADALAGQEERTMPALMESSKEMSEPIAAKIMNWFRAQRTQVTDEPIVAKIMNWFRVQKTRVTDEPMVAKIVGWLRAQKWLMTANSVEEILDPFLVKNYGDTNSYQLAQNFWDQLTPSSLQALKIFFNRWNKNASALLRVFSLKYGEAEMLQVLLKATTAGHKVRAIVATEMLKAQLVQWLNSGRNIAEVFVLLKRLSRKDVAKERVIWMGKYVQLVAEQYGDLSTYDELVKTAGTEAQLSPFFAIVKDNGRGVGRFAGRMQDIMVNGWIKKKLYIGDVLKLLDLNPLSLFKNEYRDSLYAFINKRFPGIKADKNLFIASRARYGDGALADGAMQMLGGKGRGPAAAGLTKEWLFQIWKRRFGNNKKLLMDMIMEESPLKGLTVTEARAKEIATEFAHWKPS